MTRVLLVDDDPTVAEVAVGYLERAGLAVSHVADGQAALDAAGAWEPDLVVLDLMLPGLDGLEVCRRLRSRRGDLPVVILSARGEEDDRVLGLEVGADDYVTKPFSPRELVLRVQSVLRRAQASARTSETVAVVPPTLTDGDVRLDPVAHQAWRGEAELLLTAREFDLLRHLLTHPGRAFTREELMREVWGWEYADLSTVTVHVRRLREKVEAHPSAPSRLVTVWGVGYRWEPSGGGAP